MRQTAAIQISLDRGDDPAGRWRLLNDLAPYLIAIFTNSPRYLGEDTGHRSFRANCWRRLDPSRTGVAEPDDDAASAYARFALGATDIVGGDVDAHLTTLFPEVRPRGHFEVRSCDAIDPRWYAAPVVLLSALAYDARSSAEAALLAAESRPLLRVAGEQGLRDVSIARTARDLCQLALAGARRLGPAFIGGDALDRGVEYFATYTLRDQSPADDRAYLERMRTVRSRSSRV
jgi:glutamate--cysteine ligase